MPHRFMTLPEIRRAAKTILPPGPWAFGDGGAETETTLRRNRTALKQLAIRQRVLRYAGILTRATQSVAVLLSAAMRAAKWMTT